MRVRTCGRNRDPRTYLFVAENTAKNPSCISRITIMLKDRVCFQGKRVGRENSAVSVRVHLRENKNRLEGRWILNTI